MENIKFIAFFFFLIFTCSAYASAEQEVTFPFTVEEFKNSFNKQSTIDKGSLIKSVKLDEGSWILKLDDKRFQESVQSMKNMNLLNGAFKLKTKLLLDIANNKKVKLIIVEGDRSDPANVFNLIGTVGTIIEMLNPGISQDEVAQFIMSLGLMRGDDDPTIGQPIVQIDKGGEFDCNNQLSDTSTKFGCAIIPRS